LLDKSAPLVLQGIGDCIRAPGPLRNEIITSPDFWVILRTHSKNQAVASTVFDILEAVTIESSPPAIMADNYESAVGLLNDFASAGSVGSAREQKQDKRVRKGQQAKQPRQQSVMQNFLLQPGN
jgi:brefeldin A-resistance guanine nucleotide exchange factor 1